MSRNWSILEKQFGYSKKAINWMKQHDNLQPVLKFSWHVKMKPRKAIKGTRLKGSIEIIIPKGFWLEWTDEKGNVQYFYVLQTKTSFFKRKIEPSLPKLKFCRKNNKVKILGVSVYFSTKREFQEFKNLIPK